MAKSEQMGKSRTLRSDVKTMMDVEGGAATGVSKARITLSKRAISILARLFAVLRLKDVRRASRHE